MKSVYRSFARQCREESGVSTQLIEEFSNGEDINKLPADHELKCYIYCQYVHLEMMDEGVPIYKHEISIENIEVLSPEAQKIYMSMGSKCQRIKSKSKDPCEIAYLNAVCMKKADINVSQNILCNFLHLIYSKIIIFFLWFFSAIFYSK